MRSKIVCAIIWIAVTALYIFLYSDYGRSDGANVNSAIEDYVEYSTAEYTGAEGIAAAVSNSWMYSYFDDMEAQFKSTYTVLAATNVIYFVITVVCYHFGFIHKKAEEPEAKSDGAESKEKEI